jgi:energy-coupling factor transporter ATP-binding protein EcfA2
LVLELEGASTAAGIDAGISSAVEWARACARRPTVSGGERQRRALAPALLALVPVLDESTAPPDRGLTRRVMARVTTWLANAGYCS